MKEHDLKIPGELTLAEIEDALRQCGGDTEEAAEILEVSAHGLRMRIKKLRTPDVS